MRSVPQISRRTDYGVHHVHAVLVEEFFRAEDTGVLWIVSRRQKIVGFHGVPVGYERVVVGAYLERFRQIHGVVDKFIVALMHHIKNSKAIAHRAVSFMAELSKISKENVENFDDLEYQSKRVELTHALMQLLQRISTKSTTCEYFSTFLQFFITQKR